jgi:hypothetical protein
MAVSWSHMRKIDAKRSKQSYKVFACSFAEKYKVYNTVPQSIIPRETPVFSAVYDTHCSLDELLSAKQEKVLQKV